MRISSEGQRNESYLIISDLQMPFEHQSALKFCSYLKRHYGIPDQNVFCVGDEVDNFHGSLHDKGSDFDLTPRQELKLAKEKLREWYSEFPQMKLAISNHGIRWLKKAMKAEILSDVMLKYEEILEAPKGWVWRDRWIMDASKQPFIVTHGMEYGGMYAFRQAPLLEGCSVAFGHLHSSAGIAHIRTNHMNIWGMNTGCLIDTEAFAFKYSKWNRFKANITAGVVIGGGKMPVLVPLE